jgi:hypothetical protein
MVSKLGKEGINMSKRHLRLSLILFITLFNLPVTADILVPEKADTKNVQQLLYYLDRAINSETPSVGIPYIRALADSDYPNKLAVLYTYYDFVKELLENSKSYKNSQSQQLIKSQLLGLLDIIRANIHLVEAEQKYSEIARKVYIEMVNNEQESIGYRAEALRRLEDNPPKEIAKSLPIFLPDWEEKPGGRQYKWKVHPAITIRAVRMMKKVCGKEIVPLLDNWLREFQATNSIWAELRDTLVDVYWELRLAGLSVEEKITIAVEELFKWKGHGLMPREAFIKIGRDAVPTLIKLLYIPDSRINGSAEWALAKIKDERAIEHLARIIDDIVINPAPIFRATTVWAIGEIGGKKAAEVLKQLLKRKDEHPSVIGEALEGLGKIGDTSAEDLILPLLSHSNKKIRYHAANALKTCGTQKSVPFLLQCFEIETNHAVKVAIAHALKALGISVEVKSMSLNEK